MAFPSLFKDHVKNVMTQVSHLNIQRVNLNKSRPKSSYSYGTTKGVESDHIQIFKNEKTSQSFAFSYMYENIESPYIRVTFKDKEGEMIESIYSPEGFKEKVREFVKILKVMNASQVLSAEALDKAYQTHFIKAPEVDPAVVVADSVKRIKVQIKSASEKYKKDLSLETKLQAEVDHFKASMKTLEAQWEKELDIKNLESKLKSAKAELQKRIAKEEKNADLAGKVLGLRKTTAKLKEFDSLKESIINEELAKISKAQRVEVLKKINGK